MRLLIASVFFCLLLTSCGPTVVYEQEYDIEESGWTYADSLSFNFTIEDTTLTYEYLLDLTHSADFPHQNFYVNLHTRFPSGQRSSQQLSLQMADNFGQWYGDCGGETCELSIPILQKARFQSPGAYSLTVEQNTRENPLQNINALGLRVVVSE